MEGAWGVSSSPDCSGCSSEVSLTWGAGSASEGADSTSGFTSEMAPESSGWKPPRMDTTATVVAAMATTSKSTNSHILLWDFFSVRRITGGSFRYVGVTGLVCGLFGGQKGALPTEKPAGRVTALPPRPATMGKGRKSR